MNLYNLNFCMVEVNGKYLQSITVIMLLIYEELILSDKAN